MDGWCSGKLDVVKATELGARSIDMGHLKAGRDVKRVPPTMTYKPTQQNNGSRWYDVDDGYRRMV
jgi:hypothetical protein